MTAPPGGEEPGVGIVVVSHSRALADAAVALAAEMLHGREPRIAVAAGIDATAFGTDAVQIKAAIERVDSEAGVVVLMDMGSAVMSAELALDLLEGPVRNRVLLSPAPLVEGLVVAAVAAAGGAARTEVAAQADAALLGKSAHLAADAPPADAPPADAPPADAAVDGGPSVVGTFTVENTQGLHARPAARLVAEVGSLDATVTLRNLTTGKGPVPAGNLLRVATLAASQGHVMEVAVSGRQAQAALDHLLALARRRFDEEPSTPGPTDSR
ncbi:MAG: Multiphosphoryl transfer protein [Blastococcus sp.]|jgi:dihydroxyacetone kinase phosphotransfer subunit|nr:Multiphosphoryl transfer protein [Blastococcus sp.]